MKNGSNYQFEAIFIPQKEGGFTVEVPDLPGCVSEGDTIKEAEKNIKEAMTLCLKVAQKDRSYKESIDFGTDSSP